MPTPTWRCMGSRGGRKGRCSYLSKHADECTIEGKCHPLYTTIYKEETKMKKFKYRVEERKGGKIIKYGTVTAEDPDDACKIIAKKYPCETIHSKYVIAIKFGNYYATP